MKILHIVPLVSDDSAFGGPVRGTVRQSHALREMGADSHILALWRGAGSAPDTVMGIPATLFPFRRLPGHRFATAFSLRPIFWLIKNRNRYDCVHVHSGRDLWILVVMIFLRVTGTPYVLQTHGMLAPRDGAIYKVYDFALTRPAVNGASTIMYLTPYEERDLQAVCSPKLVAHVVNGVDDIDAVPVSHSSSGVLRLVFVSRIHPRKRLVDLVRAVAIQIDRNAPVHLDIYGPDEGALAEVISLVEELDMREHITYREALPYDEVRSTLQQYDVMILPSVNEPFPNIVLESMASGTPVIITTSCGLAKYLEDGDAGLVVDPGPASLSEALSRMQEPSERKRLSENGFVVLENHFTMTGVAKTLTNIYKKGGIK